MDYELLKACEAVSFAASTAFAAKPLLERLLGPSFDYAGKATADLLARYGNINLKNVFRRVAARRQNDSINVVHPRVLKAVIEDSSFVDDEVTQEYFAGLLATAMTIPNSEDALTFLGLIRNLTATQIRLHHIYYSVKRSCHLMNVVQPEVDRDLFIADRLLPSFTGSDRSRFLRHAVLGLVREDLISREYNLSAHYYVPHMKADYDGIILKGTSLGAELFLWVYGHHEGHPTFICFAEAIMGSWQAIHKSQLAALQSEALLQQMHIQEVFTTALRACENATNGGDIGDARRALTALCNECGSLVPEAL